MNFLLMLLAITTFKGEIMPEGLRIVYEPSQAKQVDFLYSKDGSEWYPVATIRNPGFRETKEDTFYWIFPNCKWSGGQLKVVFRHGEWMEERKVELRKKVEDQATTVEFTKEESNPQLTSLLTSSPLDSQADPYAWRMFQYDAQHTGYYPHALYPPLELQWTYTGETGGNFQMISGCAGNGMLYVGGGGGSELSKIKAMDIETGELVWERLLTSNVWTAALSPGDSLLFVGTSIEPSLTQPTFFCLDALNGEVRWSEHLATVEFQPIVVDSAVYFTNLQGAMYAFSTRGIQLWEIYAPGFPISLGTPAHWQNQVFVGGENRVLLSLDALTGDTIWSFPTPGWVDSDPVIDNGLVYISSQPWPDGIIYVLDCETGQVVWEKHEFPVTSPYTITAHAGKIYINRGFWGEDSLVYDEVYCLNGSDGTILWTKIILGGEISTTRIPLTSNGRLWLAGEWVYSVNPETGDIIYQSEQVPAELTWAALFWPIIYKEYLIGAHREVVYAFKGSTTSPDTQPLLSIYPNPFTDETTVRFVLSKESSIKFYVYDLCGRLVNWAHEGAKPPGVHLFSWRGDNYRGNKVSSGIYFISLEKKGGERVTRKIVYLKGR